MLLDEASHHLLVGIQRPKSGFLIFPHEATIAFYIRTEDSNEFTFNFLRGHGVSLKNSIKGREKIGLFIRVFTLLLTKNYSFWIKMSTRIKRLTFAILYCKAKSKNAEEEVITEGSFHW
jgi:hypothetical protein